MSIEALYLNFVVLDDVNLINNIVIKLPTHFSMGL